jgi:hypothetical protein
VVAAVGGQSVVNDGGRGQEGGWSEPQEWRTRTGDGVLLACELVWQKCQSRIYFFRIESNWALLLGI